MQLTTFDKQHIFHVWAAFTAIDIGGHLQGSGSDDGVVMCRNLERMNETGEQANHKNQLTENQVHARSDREELVYLNN
jgi:hypothetical protein